ncbi:MAG: sigma-54 dependent transcriptional regulator, partial [candidate division Zixibacteria bacterium]
MDKPCVLIVDDDARITSAISEYLHSFDYNLKIASTGAEALAKIGDPDIAMVMLDINLPDFSGFDVLGKIKEINSSLPVVMMTGFVSTEAAIEAMKMGAYEFITKPFDIEKIASLVNQVLNKSSHLQGLETFSKEKELMPGDIIGRSPEMMEIAKLIGQVATSDASVLIHGESGTGKELVARAIYKNSLRKDKPFLSVNCAALPDTLLESELFGHEKGAFTGAIARKDGKFEAARGGTIFLDEISEMNPSLQAKLLRVLQEKTFERVGGIETIRTDVRVIAATNEDLQTLVKKSSFRDDLYYRLKVITIDVPPLRERKEDIA